MGFLNCFALAALLATQALAQTTTSTFSPLRPPSIPLAVRFPYLSTWLEVGSDGGNGGYLAGEWPSFWNGQTTGWTGMVQVDGLNYVWMGQPGVNASIVNQTAFSYTSTRSTFTMDIEGAVGMTIEFLSPVLPSDFERSSIPFSYMNVEVWSKDGHSHAVKLYTDVSAEWVSGNRGDVAQWDYEVIPGTAASKRDEPDAVLLERAVEIEERAPPPYRTFGTKTAYTPTINPRPTTTFAPPHWQPHPYPTWHTTLVTSRTTSTTHSSPVSTVTPTPTATQAGIAVHHVFRQTQQLFSEDSDQALWGDFYYSTLNVANLTYQSGQDVVVRNQFVDNGHLADVQDYMYRPINDDWPVFGFSVDLGHVTPVAVSTLFTVGFVQEQAIQFEGAAGNVSLPAYWTNSFSSNDALIAYAYGDYAEAGTLSTAIDNKVSSDSIAAAGQDYASITTLAVRQAYGALQIAGTPDEMYIFLKEISSDGNIQTVDVIFPTHPILLYLSPNWLGLMLEPLFINQEAGHWPYAFSIHDLGDHYPNATGHDDGQDEMQPLEECGNMLIMTLGYAQRTNDNAFLSAHYDLLRQWNNFLVEESLIPANQISTDDFAGALANQTNLAIKGIIGIAAMASIANLTGNTADGANFTQIALSYISQWQTLATAPANSSSSLPTAHTTLNYGNDSSYSLLYNLWADRNLNLGLVPQGVYDMQSAFYPSVVQTYGVPLDTRHTYTKADWEMFCAAVAGAGTRQLFVEKIATWLAQTVTNLPFGDLYDTISGDYPGFSFEARPVVGGEFALLSLLSAPATPAL